MNTSSSRCVRLVKPIRTSSSPSKKTKPGRVAPLAAAIASVCFPSLLHAATATWTGGAGATWDNTATNWSNVSGTPWDSTNGLTDAAVFNTVSATPSVSGTVWANSLTFSQTTTISNGTINLAGASPTITANANATIASVLAGTSGIQKNGGWTLTLTSSNTYTGTTAVNAGPLTLGGTAGSILSSTTINVTGGSTLTLDNSSTSLNNRIAASSTVTLSGNGTFAFNGNGTTASTTQSFSTLALGGGAATVTLANTGVGQLQTLAAANLSRAAGATALIRGSNLQTAVTNATRLTVGGAAGTGLTLVGAGTGAVGVSTSGTNTTLSIVPYLIGDTNSGGTGTGFLTYDTDAANYGLRLLAAGEYNTLSAAYTTPATVENVNAFNGTISTGASVTVNSLRFNTAGQTLNGSGGSLVVNSGAILGTANNLVIGGSFSGLTLGNGSWNEGIVTQTTGTLTINAPISVTGGGGLTKAGAGTLVLSASDAIAGGVTVNGGALQVNSANALGTGTLTINNGAGSNFHFNLPTSGTVANSIVANTQVNLYLDASNNLTLAGNIVPNSNISFYPNTAATSGTITFTGSNSFAGNYFCSGTNLTLRFGSTNSTGSAAWWPDGSAKIILLNGVTFNGTLVPQGYTGQTFTVGMDASGAATFAGRIYTAAAGVPTDIDVPAGAQLTLSGPFSGSWTYLKTGAGTAIVSNAANALEAFVVSGGVLQVPNTSAIGTGTFGTTLDGGTLQYTGASGSTSRPLTITANGGAFDASGSGPITYSSTAAVLYTGSGNRTLTLTGTNTGANTLAAAIADSGTGTVALVKSGAGTWVLTGSNSYSGSTQINAGTLSVAGANSLPGGSLTVSGSGALAVGNAVSDASVSAILAGATFASGAGFGYDTTAGSRTAGSNIGGGLSLVKIGGNTLTLTGSNSYTGSTTASSGTLALGPSAVLSSPTSGLTLSGAALDLGTTSQTVGAVSITAAASGTTLMNGTLSGTSFAVSNASGTAVLSANLAGAGAMTMSGAGALWLSGSSTFSGGVTVNAGALQVNSPNALGTGTLTINNGAPSMYFNTSGTVANPMSINEGYTFYNSGSNNLVLTGNINGNGNTVNLKNASASGTITLTGSNYFNINGFDPGLGTLRLGSNYALGNGTTMRATAGVKLILLDGVTCPNGIAQTGGWYGMDASGTAAFTGGVWPPSSYTVSTVAGSQLTFNCTLYQTGTLNKIGAGTATLVGIYNSAQAPVVSGGVLQYTTTAAIGSGTTYAITLDGGTLQYATGGSGTMTNPIVLTANGGAFDASGSGPITYSSTAAVLYTGSGNRTLTLTGANTGQNTLAAYIPDSGTGTVALAKSGAGTWVLSSSNSYSGGTVVSNGVLLVGNANALGTGTTTVNGGVLEFPSPWWSKMASALVSSGGLGMVVGGTGFASVDVDALFSGAGGVFLNPGETVLFDTSNNSGAFTYGSVISANVALIKTGTNALVLSSSNTYAGSTRLSVGSLNGAVVANGGQPSSIGASSNAASNLIIENGAQLNASGTTDRLFTLGSSGQAWISGIGAPLVFTNTGDIAVSGSATHNLRLTGNATNTFAPAVHDYNSSNKTQLTVQNCTWLVTATASDYTGVTNIDASGVLVASSIANSSMPSSIGASTSAASNLVFGYDAAGGNNTLRYVGAGAASTDRLFTLGSLLGGGAVTTIDNSGGGTLSFTNAGAISVATTASTTLAFAGSNAIVFAPAIVNGSGTVGVSMSGSNTLTLTGSNTYTGATSITGGTLQVGNGGTVGSIASTSSVSVSSGATLAFARTDNYGGNLTKAIGGAGALVLNSGSLTLTGSNTYTGATTVAAGAALQLGDGVTGAMASAVTLNNGSTLGINLPNGGIFNAGINIGPGTVNLTSSGTNFITGQINGYTYSALNQNGSGTTVLSYTNPFYGAANVNAGALQLNAQYAAYDATVNVGSSGLLTFGPNGLNTNIGGLSGSGTVILQNGTNGVTLAVGGNNQNTVFSGNLSGSNGSLVMSGTCVLALTGTSSYAGLTSVNSGTLQIGNGGTAGSIASSGSISIASGATLAFNRTDNYDAPLSQAVSGSGRILISSGSLTVSSTSSFSGDIAVAGGTLVPGIAAPLPSANLDAEGGTLNFGPLVSASFGGLKGAGNLNVLSTSGSATLNVGGNNQTTTFSGGLSGSNFSLTKVGTGTLTLSGSSSFTGGVTLAAGALQLNNASALGSGGALTITEDADIALNFNLPTSGTVNNAITFTKPGGTHNDSIVQNANNNLTLAGNIVATGQNLSFNEASGITSGTFTLTGSNSFGGLYTSGTATFRIGSSYAAGGAVWRPSVNANIILLNGVNFGSTIGNSIASYGMEASGTAAFTADVDQGSALSINTPAGAQLSFTGVYRGNGAITKTGAGTAIFTNLYNYGMPITISGGVIQVSNMAIVTGEIGAGISGTTYTTTLDGGTFRYVGGSGTTARPLALTANGGALDASGGGALVFSTPAVAYTGSGNRTLTLTGSNTGLNTLAAAISDNGSQVSVYKTGAGTWVLSGSNSYSGGTQLNGGNLQLGSANAIGATGPISFGGGTLQFSASNTTDYSVSFSAAAGQAFSIDTNGQSITFAGALTSSGGSLTKSGSGTLVLAANSAYDGATTISGGTLQAGNGGTTGSLGAGAVTDNGVLAFNRSDAVTIGTVIGGTGSLTQAGAGELTLTASNGYTGATAVTGGTLALLGSGALSGVSALTINGGTLDMGSLNATNKTGGNNGITIGSGGGTLAGTGTLSIVGQNGGATAFGLSAGASAVVNENLVISNTANQNYEALASFNGSGSLTINGKIAFAAGGLWIGGGGTLFVTNTANSLTSFGFWGNGAATAISTPSFATLGSYHLAVLGQNTSQAADTLIYTGTTVSTNFYFQSGALSPSFLNNGSGTVTFTSPNLDNSYGSPTSASIQTLTLGGTSDIVVNGAIQDANPALTGSGSISFVSGVAKSGPNTLTLAGTNTYHGPTSVNQGTLQIGNGGATGSLNPSGAITDNATLVFNRSNTLTQGTDFSSAISGSGNVAQNGGGTTILSGSNGYTGLTTLNAGTLSLAGANALAGGGNIVFAGGKLQFTAGNTADYSSRIFNSAGAMAIDTNGQTVSFAGAIDASNTGGLTKSGSGTLSLSGSNSYSGTTTVSSGTLQVGNANALGTGGLTVNNGTLDLNNNSVSVSSLSGSAGLITNTASGTSNLTASIASGTSTYNGGITDGSGSVVLNQNGAGTLILGGSITMSGLNANNGLTQIQQSVSIGSLSVASGATVTLAANATGARSVLQITALTMDGLTTEALVTAAAAATSKAEAGAQYTAEPGSPEAVPEPGALLFLIVGGAGLLGGRRRRAKRA